MSFRRGDLILFAVFACIIGGFLFIAIDGHRLMREDCAKQGKVLTSVGHRKYDCR